MLRDARMARRVKLLRGIGHIGQRRLWAGCSRGESSVFGHSPLVQVSNAPRMEADIKRFRSRALLCSQAGPLASLKGPYDCSKLPNDAEPDPGGLEGDLCLALKITADNAIQNRGTKSTGRWLYRRGAGVFLPV